MRTFLVIMFLSIGSMVTAQQKIPIDSLKVGDTFIVDKKCTALGEDGEWWKLVPSEWQVTDVFVFQGRASSIQLFCQANGETKRFDTFELLHLERKRKIHAER